MRSTEDRVLIIEQFIITHKETSDIFKKDMITQIVLMGEKIDTLITSQNAYQLKLAEDKVECQNKVIGICKEHTATAIKWCLAVPIGVSTIVGAVFLVVRFMAA